MNTRVLTVPPLHWNGHQFDVLNDDNLSDDLTIVSALKNVLHYQGFNISKKMIAGLTGAAFYIGWNSETLMSGMGGAVFQFPHMNTDELFPEINYCGYNLLFRYLDLEVEIIDPKDSFLVDKCRESLGNNIPLVAIEWDPVSRRGHAAILSGISSDGNNFSARIYDHEKCDQFISVSPEDLLYVIHQKKSNDAKSNNKSQIIFNSLQNALNILRGNSFNDKEKWILGIQSYQKQCDLIKHSIDIKSKNYKLVEHFLYWRLQILLVCRTYAYMYINELIAQNLDSFDNKKLNDLKQNYDHFISFFNNSLEIQNDIDSIINGTPLIWKTRGKNEYIEEIFKTEKGKSDFCDFLSELYSIDMKGIELLENIISATGLF